MQVINKVEVEILNEKVRLYDYLLNKFEQLPSRKSVKKAIDKGLVKVNDVVQSTGFWLSQNDVITLHENISSKPKAYQLKLKVVFDDDYLTVINKPAGISVSGNQYRTIQNAIIDQLTISSQPDVLNWPKPVHRLDNQTSGLLVIAKTAKAIVALGDMFKENKIHKTYHAIVCGQLNGSGVINSSIDGLASETSYETLKVVSSLKNEFVSLMKVSPKTGRTHQIRKHFKSIGHPIMGDKLYGEAKHTLTGKGLFLASTGISFIHPITNKKMTVEIDIPHKFSSLLEREQRRWDFFK